MSDQYLGEIRVFGCNFAPYEWALCNGQLLPISQYTALFSLLGTFYGGNGTTNFALPNLQGSFPLNQGNGAGLTPREMGETGGETSVTLLQTQLPAHTHPVACAAGSGTPGPSNAVFGGIAGRGKAPAYAAGSALATAGVNMSASAVANTGGGQPHNNLQPYLVLNFCIALTGIYPARS
jgi:microcystin-dependent protein